MHSRRSHAAKLNQQSARKPAVSGRSFFAVQGRRKFTQKAKRL